MEGEVVHITADKSCRVRLKNDILVAFAEPAGHTLQIGDRIQFGELRLDSLINALIDTRGIEFRFFLASKDVHDLRLPIGHGGGSRTPTHSRLNGD